jgi:hypothetical protein
MFKEEKSCKKKANDMPVAGKRWRESQTSVLQNLVVYSVRLIFIVSLRALLSACPGARRGAFGASAAGQGSNPLKIKRLLRQKTPRNDYNFYPKPV